MNASSSAPDGLKVMDFVNFAYYVEATLSTAELLATHPAQIAIVKVYTSPTVSANLLTVRLAEGRNARPG